MEINTLFQELSCSAGDVLVCRDHCTDGLTVHMVERPRYRRRPQLARTGGAQWTGGERCGNMLEHRRQED